MATNNSASKRTTSEKPAPKRSTRNRTTRTQTAATANSTAAKSMAAGEVPAPTIPVTSPEQFGRIVVMDVTPSAEQGMFPARVELGEPFEVTAQVFIEGRTKVGATAVLRNPRGREMQRAAMTCANPGLDRWTVMLQAGEHSDLKPWDEDYAAVKRQLGEWTVTIEGWEDTYTSWLHDARIKVQVGDDVENALETGAEMLNRWAHTADAHLSARDRKHLEQAAERMSDKERPASARLAEADNPRIEALHKTHPLRDGISESRPQRFKVERPKSSFAAWYQFFPRSEGAYRAEDGTIVQGNFKTALTGLDRAAEEGFDIVYLPPIFPIGVTNRKGRNNSLVAGPHDPGSPFGIGSELGGHDTVDPLLGTMDDFKAFVAHAHELGLEIALDFALQCSPDHPWVKQHPNWFRIKPDGTIAFAENPPKKYQDIYPIDFNADMPGIEREVERIMNLWIEAGVTIFRIDNPHTKPVRFWQDVIAAVTKKHPEVLFLAEAFTRPGMMRALSYVGFTQSHCYFPWRNTKEELAEYLLETNGNDGYYQHNTFWPTTPDILTAYVRDNGIAGHAVRAVLAAMGSPSWGIYNGYELIENRQRPGFEEQIDNEKYEIKVRDWKEADKYGIAELLGSLNEIRRNHPATRSYHNLTVLPTSDPSILAFARHTPAALTGTGQADTLIVVVNLDGYNAHQSTVHIELPELGLPTDRAVTVRDELTGREFQWGWDNFVSLAPWADVAHILSVQG
ncbi:alpha-1,4-glucan--maltose-1-phosphate maltosyltransferase [Bifidobacterium pullorum]|uniref:Alpha-1,4-glucan:maltose-1-phosphate maltosyltransferase n=1 Tax=Bifidobacterium pullorum subsp. gallinarum TaxID=78344 RepID=A0A921J0Y0_9BIFI|nr:alpha-1,4-glucan--maltose-1-phosphate maltosyltransferase [Bifidobacterium pullorum]HJG42383.1 alpha-1,4-glucan--maltose-1-phosphate maltosyltransferase [Bifidobacterium pullorum subsp. gallinarum]